MKYLRIIAVYISLLVAAACVGTQAPVQEQPDPVKISVTMRNDTDRIHIVWIYDRHMDNTNVFCAEVKPGADWVYTYMVYNHTYDIFWATGRPDYKKVHYYSFRVRAGTVHFLTTPSRTTSQYGDIDADWDAHDNTEHLR